MTVFERRKMALASTLLWLTAVVLLIVSGVVLLAESLIPEFGRDTVLIWKIEGPEYEKSFVARIAVFNPDRFLEWEDEKGQGTVFMAERDVLNAKGYERSNLFIGGMDRKSNNATTLWLSRRIFLELKEKKNISVNLNGIAAKFRYLGEDKIPVTVNRTVVELPVIRIADDRRGEWRFLDRADNPLFVRYETQNYSKTLASVTTDRANTLRWIKKDSYSR